MKLVYKYTIAFISLIISLWLDNKIIELVTFLRNYLNSSLLDSAMSFLADYISLFIIFILMTSFFLRSKTKRSYLPFLWLSFFTSLAITHLLKISIDRPRPFINHASLSPLIEKSNPSFPSGHMTAVSSSIPVFNKEFPKLKYLWIIFAVLIASARLYTGIHYLSDLIAGSIVGSLVSYFYLFLCQKVIKKPKPFF